MEHKTLLVTFGLVFVMAYAAFAAPPGRDMSEADDAPAKRGFSSYYSNSYYDEIAMAVCASIPMKNQGFIFPVRRRCVSGSSSCNTVCKSAAVRRQIAWYPKYKYECIESLHIYKSRPQLSPNPAANTDVGKVGLIIYRYHTCTHRSCGPNYCCCRKGP